MNAPLRTHARGLWGAVLRYAAGLGQLVRHSPPTRDARVLQQRLACARLALRAGSSLKAGAGAPERAEVVLLGLVNARAAVLCLAGARGPAVSALDHADDRSLEPLEPGLRGIVQRSIEDDIKAAPGQVRRDFELLLAHGERVLSELQAPARRALALRSWAWVRMLAPPLALAIVIAVAGWRLFGAREVSAGKPWATSSVGFVCDPAHGTCGGTRTNILFHTLEEADPWFEIDLGQAYELTRIEVRNRTDCCAERALPLVVEVSLDRHEYRMVARKFAVFDQWTQRLPATHARYVRLRVAGRSVLHLEGVEVYGRRLE